MKHLNKIIILFLLCAAALFFAGCGYEDITNGKYVAGKVVNVAYEHNNFEYYGTIELCDTLNHDCRYVFYDIDKVNNQPEAIGKDKQVLIKLKKSKSNGFVYVSELKLKADSNDIVKTSQELTKKIPFDSHGYTHGKPIHGNHNIWHINKNNIDWNQKQDGYLLVECYPKGTRSNQNENIKMYIPEADVKRDTFPNKPLEFYESARKIRGFIIGLIHEH